MSAETLLAAGYVAVLWVVALGLDIYGRQSTAAWESRVFTGYNRAVDEAPPAVGADTWPHSEVHRFHRAFALFVCVVGIVLAAAETVRHHSAAEIALLTAVCAPHCVLLALLGRSLRRARVTAPE